MSQPIVRSLLETDLYKFTMWQALLHGHPNSHTEYEFVCRNTPVYPLAELLEAVERELDHLCSMGFSDEELNFLRSLRYIKSDFADFLTVFRFQRKFIDVRADGDTLVIRAAGPQVHVMGFEIYVLYIVNELYFRRFDQHAALAEGASASAPRSPRSRPSAPSRRAATCSSSSTSARAGAFPAPGMTRWCSACRARCPNSSRARPTSTRR